MVNLLQYSMYTGYNHSTFRGWGADRCYTASQSQNCADDTVWRWWTKELDILLSDIQKSTLPWRMLRSACRLVVWKQQLLLTFMHSTPPRACFQHLTAVCLSRPSVPSLVLNLLESKTQSNVKVTNWWFTILWSRHLTVQRTNLIMVVLSVPHTYIELHYTNSTFIMTECGRRKHWKGDKQGRLEASQSLSGMERSPHAVRHWHGTDGRGTSSKLNLHQWGEDRKKKKGQARWSSSNIQICPLSFMGHGPIRKPSLTTIH